MSEEISVAGLTSKEVVEKVYERLKEGRTTREVVFPEQVLALIGDDSDWHRSRMGYMGYNLGVVCQFGLNTWILSLGEACGSYPADPYSNDLLVLRPSPEELTDNQIQSAIQRSTFFSNSVLFALKDGSLGAGRDEFMMKEIDFRSFVAQRKEVDSEYIALSTLQPVVRRPTLWRDGLIDRLVESITQILSNGS